MYHGTPQILISRKWWEKNRCPGEAKKLEGRNNMRCTMNALSFNIREGVEKSTDAQERLKKIAGGNYMKCTTEHLQFYYPGTNLDEILGDCL
jgi:hypothetical protein